MDLPHPSIFEPHLTDEVISFIAGPMLDIYNDTMNTLNHRYDSNYTRGCVVFGRTYECIINLITSRKCAVPILLKDGTFKCIFQIGSALIRFCKDDFLNPIHKGFKGNAQSNYDMFPANTHEPIYWRFILNEPTSEEDEAIVIFAGYNINDDVVAYWDSNGLNGTNYIHMADPETPKAVELDSPFVEDPDMDEQEDDDSEATGN